LARGIRSRAVNTANLAFAHRFGAFLRKSVIFANSCAHTKCAGNYPKYQFLHLTLTTGCGRVQTVSLPEPLLFRHTV
jgi:hypothetical protein